MKCPNCGATVDGASPFCPSCGADLTGDVRRRRRVIGGIDRGVRRGVSVAVIVVAAICVLAVVASAVRDGSGGGDPAPDADGVIDAGSTYIVLSEGFGDGSLSAELRDTGLMITLDPGIASGYSQFQWRLRDDSGTGADAVTKSEPNLLWMDVGPGTWTVSVSCGDSSGYYAEYHGTMECVGDTTLSWSWTHGGRSLGVSVTVSREQMLLGISRDRPGEGASAGEAASMVDPGGAAGALESRIWSAYRSQSDGSRSSEDYACCILEFVSACFEVRPDVVTHGEPEYWAVPEETMVSGAGDTGDLAVLAASLLKSAGFDVGIVHLQGEWAVMIALEPEAGEASDGRTLMSIEAGGVTYWVCSVSDFAGVGQMPSEYSEDGTEYCGLPAEVSVGIC